MVMITLYAKQKKKHRCTEWTFRLWEKVRVGCFERTTSKQVYYLGWNRSPAQAGCMRQVLGPGALGRPRGIGWRGTWEGGSEWGTHVNPWLIHVNVWQKPLQYCKIISLQLIKINGKKKYITISIDNYNTNSRPQCFYLTSLILYLNDLLPCQKYNSQHQHSFSLFYSIVYT